MTRRDHFDRRMAEEMETVLTELAAADPGTATGGPPVQRVRLIAAFVIVLALLVPAGIFAFSNHPRRSAPPATEIPVDITSTVATVGALPNRASLLIHGTAELQPLDPARADDLRAYARQMHLDPDQALADNATTEAFDAAITTAQSASTSYTDAVYEPGRRSESVLRFTARPSEQLLTTLREQYPGNLRIEWSDRFLDDGNGTHLSSTVFSTIADVPGVDPGTVLTGIDGDERLNASYRGTASLRSVVNALLGSTALRATFVQGRPRTEIRITRVPEEVVTPPATTEPGAVRVVVATKKATAIAGVGVSSGKLTVSSHNCLSLHGKTIVAPPGSTFTDGTLRIPGHPSIAVGEVVDTTDVTPVDDSAYFRHYLPADAQQCGTAGYMWMYPFG